MVQCTWLYLQGMQEANIQGTHAHRHTSPIPAKHNYKPGVAKNNYKGKTKAKPQSTEELDYSRVRVKVNGHPALALVHLQTTGGNLINTQFVHLYGLPTYGIDKKSLNTAIK